MSTKIHPENREENLRNKVEGKRPKKEWEDLSTGMQEKLWATHSMQKFQNLPKKFLTIQNN